MREYGNRALNRSRLANYMVSSGCAFLELSLVGPIPLFPHSLIPYPFKCLAQP
jgi:hypothetical protein